MVKLDRTDSAKLMTIRVFGGTDMQLGRTDMVRLGHNVISVRPITQTR